MTPRHTSNQHPPQPSPDAALRLTSLHVYPVKSAAGLAPAAGTPALELPLAPASAVTTPATIWDLP